MADLKMNLSQLETKRDELIKEIDAASVGPRQTKHTM